MPDDSNRKVRAWTSSSPSIRTLLFQVGAKMRCRAQYPMPVKRTTKRTAMARERIESPHRPKSEGHSEQHSIMHRLALFQDRTLFAWQMVGSEVGPAPSHPWTRHYSQEVAMWEPWVGFRSPQSAPPQVERKECPLDPGCHIDRLLNREICSLGGTDSPPVFTRMFF